jgi:hypothetical protein
MALARAARTALALMVASAAPAAAQVAARPVALYPFARSEGAAAEDAQALLESALQRAAKRTDDIALSEPIFVRGACGPAQSAPTACLARLAGNGLVLRAILHRSERTMALGVEAVDGAGRTFGPVTVAVDPFIQNAEPLTRALLMLLEDVGGSARRQAGAAPPPPPPARAEAPRTEPAKPDLRAPEPPPPAPRAAGASVTPAAETVERSAPRRSRMRSLAPWVTGAGLALLGGAAVVSTMNESLSDELERKFEAGELTPADLASYDQVERYNTITLVLAASGGALTLTGAYLFTVAPAPGGGSVALVGRF